MAYIKHKAGEYDEETKLQLCVLCGRILTDYNGVIWITEDEPGGWTEGADVFISPDGSFKTIHVSEETEVLECS